MYIFFNVVQNSIALSSFLAVMKQSFSEQRPWLKKFDAARYV